MHRIFSLPIRSFMIVAFVYPSGLVMFLCTLVIAAIAWVLHGPIGGLLLLITGSILSSLRVWTLLMRESSRMGSDKSAIALNIRAPLLEADNLTSEGGCHEIDLGDRPLGIPFRVIIFVHNCGLETLEVETEFSWDQSYLQLDGTESQQISGKLEAGEVRSTELLATPVASRNDELKVKVRCSFSGYQTTRVIRMRTIFDPREFQVLGTKIDRWKHGLFAATCWRADIDGLDNLTNESTISHSFELSRRFGVPISLFISGRLSLDYGEWSSWVSHFPDKFDYADKSRARFEGFARYLRDRVCQGPLEYPVREGCLAEVGSHMYHHYCSSYGYDAREELAWESNLGVEELFTGSPGEGKLVDGLMNDLMKNQEIVSKVLGITPRTWAAPANLSHPSMLVALEQVGILGASEADPREPGIPKWAAPYRPDLGSVRPYHPGETGVVETQAHIYRFDPFTPTHVRCLKRAVLRALGEGAQVTYLVHPHLRQYEPFYGTRSAKLALREILSFLVMDKGSVIWNTTHSSVTEYWEKVLCPEHANVRASWERDRVIVRNKSEEPVEGIPVEVTFQGNRRCLFLFDIPASDYVEVPLYS